ncbi:MAG: IS982 family transposase [Microscillaceae bacterium]|nr:IS982 family transposase [Microscillaceae bacterium]
MLNDNTIAIYVILDDILQELGHQESSQRQVGDAMILTTVLVGAWYFGGNWTVALDYMRKHHCKEMLSKSRFCRRVHACHELGLWCFGLLAWVFKTLNVRQRYILDTFPVAVCHNIRIGRCKLLQGEDFRGKNASKRVYFYGFKVALLADESGNPIELAIYPGAYSEQSALKRLDFDLPPGSIVWQDSGFTDYEWEDFYKEHEGIEFATQRKKNSLRGDSFTDEVAKKYNRKKIETKFSEITARFPKKIHAVTTRGFQLKIFFVILAFSMIKFIEC